MQLTRARVLCILPLLGLAKAITEPQPPATTPRTELGWGGLPRLRGRALTCWDDIPSSDAASSYCTASSGSFTSGYAATYVPCDTAATHVRSATALGSGESQWLASRTASANSALRTYFPSAWGNKYQYDLDKIMSTPPRVGLAFSGGGYRAMLTGAGVLSAMADSGLLNSSLYISGLSGGAWTVGTWALLNFTNPSELLSSWNLDPTNSMEDDMEDESFCYPLQCEVWQKWNGTGLPNQHTPISYADVWSRLVARQLMNDILGNATWSGLLQNAKLTSGSQPLPILLATGRTVQDGSNTYTPDGTIYEMTPYEFGSWDPINTGAFISMKELGTTFFKGYPVPQGICISGFDNAAFIFGTTSLAITGALLNLPGFLDITMPESTANIPNPFCGFGNGTENNCGNDYSTLYLDDGGDNYQNIPLVPLLQRHRNLDTIIAADSSDDSGDGIGTCCGYNWPQGSALNWTRYYALSDRGRRQQLAFPVNSTLPSPNSALYYTPTFFGCNSNDTSLFGVKPPLIVYLPNAPYTVYSNGTSGSTVGMAWGGVAQGVLQNGVALGSTGDPSFEGIPNWDTCLACAVADRARERAGITDRSPDCDACFSAYCAESKLDDAGLVDPDGKYDPRPIGGKAADMGTYCYVYPQCEYTDLYSPVCGCVDCYESWPAACNYNESNVHYCSRYGAGEDNWCF